MKININKTRDINNKKRFNSKKNEVYLIEKNSKLLVKKSFNNDVLYETEKNFYLNTLNSNLIAELISFSDDNHELIIEYIDGTIVLNKLEEYEILQDYDNAFCLLIKLIEYLKDFSELDYIKKNKLCFYDVNLRNFLLYNNSIIGIDFEDIQQGSCKQDIVKLLAMYLFYDPTFSEFKINLVKQIKIFLETEIGIKATEINQLINKEILVIKKRRGL